VPFTIVRARALYFFASTPLAYRLGWTLKYWNQMEPNAHSDWMGDKRSLAFAFQSELLITTLGKSIAMLMMTPF
jgi:hypothetical protein